ncbi:MAG: hypothetical protein U0470_12720 [Anaerolineae bacterium]
MTRTMLAYGALIGFLAAPRGTRAAYRVLYGAEWAAAHADAVRREGMRLVIPFVVRRSCASRSRSSCG